MQVVAQRLAPLESEIIRNVILGELLELLDIDRFLYAFSGREKEQRLQ